MQYEWECFRPTPRSWVRGVSKFRHSGSPSKLAAQKLAARTILGEDFVGQVVAFLNATPSRTGDGQ